MTKTLPRASFFAAALFALLAGRTPPARADDPPPDASGAAAAPANGAPLDPADLNGDGVVTKRERRRYNRYLRRRGGGRGAPAPAAAPDDAQNAEAAAAAQSHSAAAGRSASAAAAAMKDALPSAEAGAGLSPGGAGAMGNVGKSGAAAGGSGAAAGPGSAGSAGPKASGNPADPKTPGDFVLAARSGYAPAFAAAGLKLGADGRSIVRADGSPATPADYARLRGGILAMPSALTRRPDFFTAVSPAHFDALKRGYHENPELADSVYKHVGTTAADRDFVHTASCAKMSGDCNANVDKASYKKGEFVAPEDLDRMWGSLQKELDDTGKSDDDDDAPAKNGDGLSAPTISRAADTAAPDEKTPGGTPLHGTVGSTGSATSTPTPASAAARTAARLWHSATKAMGLGGAAAGGPASRPLGFGALGAAALAALVFALRRRG